MTTIVSATESPELAYLPGPGKAAVKTAIIAYVIDGETPRPLTFPAIPSKARTFARTALGWQRFDLATGVPAGPGYPAATWEE